MSLESIAVHGDHGATAVACMQFFEFFKGRATTPLWRQRKKSGIYGTLPETAELPRKKVHLPTYPKRERWKRDWKLPQNMTAILWNVHASST